jgi:hypothetical protein
MELTPQADTNSDGESTCCCRRSQTQLTATQETHNDLQRTINVLKLLRHNLPEAQVTEESEVALADKCLELYFEGLKLGKGLPKTELQPADDLIILYAHTLVNAWAISDDELHLYQAAVALEVALTHSQQAYQIRLTLIRIYHLLGGLPCVYSWLPAHLGTRCRLVCVGTLSRIEIEANPARHLVTSDPVAG